MKPLIWTDQNHTDLRLQVIKKVQRLSRSQTVELLNLLESWLPEEESRTNPRKRCSIPVDYSMNGDLCKDYMENLSSTGCFIRCKESVSDNGEITMVFSLPNFGAPFKVQGKVVWTGMSGFGVHFNEENPYLGAMLQSL